MRSRTAPGLKGRCPRCYVMREQCLCALAPKVENRVKVLVLRHAFEGNKSTNTARVANLALGKMEIREWDPGAPPDIEALLAREGRTWLLYPGASTVEREAPPPETLLVIDGTWRQARRMLRARPQLLRLPRLGLPARARDVPRLRAAPAPEARSTLEAIADALELLEGPEIGQPLRQLHQVMVQRVLTARGYPPTVRWE